MKSALVALLVNAIAVGCSGAAVSKDHPIVKVISLIQDLKAKAISEGKEEEVAYTKFQYWCSTSISELQDAIADEKATIEELKDKLAGLEKEKASLEEEISSIEEQIKELEASAKAAKENRAEEAKLYDKADKDLESTIKAVADCIKALEAAQTTTEPSKMLLAQKHVKAVLSLVSVKMTEQQRQGLTAYADPARPTLKADGDLAKHTDKYDFKSENVIELLKELKLKFEDDRTAGTKAETNSINSYELSKEARDNSISAAKDSKSKKEKDLATTKSSISGATSELKDTQKDLKADSTSLENTQDSCATKKSEWETRSKTRSMEIEAMGEAVKILSKSTGVRTEAPGNPVPPASPVDFVQLHSARGSGANPKMKAVALLRDAAKSAHSRALERLAVEVQAHLNGPFDQINNMIEKMIFRLMDEQKKEDEHKLWCDKEIEKTEAMKENKEERIDDLKADIKVEKAAVGKLTNEIGAANKMISDIVAFMKEATEIREVGKKENALAIKDAQKAQTSLTNAIAVLEAFYKESGEIPKQPWEFIQEPVKLPKNPATWDSSYTAVADPKKQPGGIVTVLETILSDFEKMEADTKSQEAVDQKDYEATMKANKIEQAGRTKEVQMKEAEKARRNDKISSLESQKKDTNAELEKTDQYLVDLKPACVDGDSTYGDRKAARSKEITALQDAQKILLTAFEEQGKTSLVATKFLQISRHSF